MGTPPSNAFIVNSHCLSLCSHNPLFSCSLLYYLLYGVLLGVKMGSPVQSTHQWWILENSSLTPQLCALFEIRITICAELCFCSATRFFACQPCITNPTCCESQTKSIRRSATRFAQTLGFIVEHLDCLWLGAQKFLTIQCFCKLQCHQQSAS